MFVLIAGKIADMRPQFQDPGHEVGGKFEKSKAFFHAPRQTVVSVRLDSPAFTYPPQ